MKEIEKVNPDVYKKEFAILDGLVGKFSFHIFKNPVLAEANFFSEIAWYIEVLKQEFPDDWESTVNQFVNDALRIEDVFDKFLFINNTFLEIEIEWYSTHYHDGDKRYDFKVESGKSLLERSDRIYRRGRENYPQRKTILCLPGILTSLIPQWYWIWFDGSILEKKVMGVNRQNFINSLSHGVNKANKN